MFCGTSSFGHVDHGDHDGGGGGSSSAPSTPTGSRSRSRRGRPSQNPYSTRGLDTFYAVLAELEARRQRIVEKVGEKGSMIRFEYSDSQWVPIVVRLPTAMELAEAKKKRKKGGDVAKADQHTQQQQQQQQQQGGNNHNHKRHDRRASCSWSPTRSISPNSPLPDQPPAPPPLTHQEPPAATSTPPPPPPQKKLQAAARCRTPYVGPPSQGLRPLLLLALILLCLVAFGRTFAICCTCAWWYLVPSPTPSCMVESGGGRWWVKNTKTMDYGRRTSAIGSNNFRSGSRVPERPTFTSPPKQRAAAGKFMSPPKTRHSGPLSPPKERANKFMSPPKTRAAEPALSTPAAGKLRQSFIRRATSMQLD